MIVDVTKVKFTNATKVTGNNIGGELYSIRLTLPIRSEWRQFMQIDTMDMGAIVTESTKPETDLK